MEEFVVGGFMLATVKQVIDWLRYLKAGEWNGVITQAAAWGAGTVVVVIVANSDFATVANFGGFTFDKLNLWSQVIAGISVGSAASLAKDTLKSIDDKQTSAVPTLLDSRMPIIR